MKRNQTMYLIVLASIPLFETKPSKRGKELIYFIYFISFANIIYIQIQIHKKGN